MILSISLAAVVAASQIAPAIFQNPNDLLSPADLPAGYFPPDDFSAFPMIEVVVSPVGQPMNCAVLRPSYPKLDQFLCRRLIERGKFANARSSDGQAAYGVVRTFVGWTMTVSTSRVSAERAAKRLIDKSHGDGFPDLEVRLAKAPEGVALPHKIVSTVEVDEVGRIVDCVTATDGGPANLGRVACDQLRAMAPLAIVKSMGGEAVKSVRQLTVSFAGP